LGAEAKEFGPTHSVLAAFCPAAGSPPRSTIPGDPLSVDHIIPKAVGPELDNLELMPLRMNERKNSHVGQRQRDLAQRLFEAGLLSREGGGIRWCGEEQATFLVAEAAALLACDPPLLEWMLRVVMGRRKCAAWPFRSKISLLPVVEELDETKITNKPNYEHENQKSR